ncbi:hypothetical protein CAJAP_08659 [Camponotus japonicus]
MPMTAEEEREISFGKTEFTLTIQDLF